MARARQRKPTPVGFGRVSRSLKDDPRGAHRNDQAKQATEQIYGRGLVVENDGRLHIKIGEKLPLLDPSSVTFEDLAHAYNDLLQELRGT